jgi:predicted transcriptional regulator
VRTQNGHRRKVITLPDAPVREVMHTTVEVVAKDMPLSEAAHRMVRQHIHRLYVAEDGRALGVVGIKEMMRALLDANARMPIVELMHGSLVVVQAGDPLSLAVDRMIAAHHAGLVVVEDGWPVGFFTQADALAARDAPAEHRVDEWMDPQVICLPERIPVHRAVEQALALRARCVLAVDSEGIRGILTGMDFARLVAGAG